MERPVKAIVPRSVTTDVRRVFASPMMERIAAKDRPRQPMIGAPMNMMPYMGVPPGRAMMPPPPRHFIGDYAQEGEPHQKYWQILKANVEFPPQMAVIVPPSSIPTEIAIQNNHLARAICECMACTVIQTKRPNWVEPPSESLMVDQTTTADGIPIPAGAPGAWTEVLRIVTPDRWYTVLDKIGNALEDDVAFTNVEWRVQINDRSHPFQQYLGGGIVLGGIFTAQLGDPSSPTKLSMPIMVKYGDIVSVQARSVNNEAHTAYARLVGWKYPVHTIEMAGDPCRPTGMIPLWTDGGSNGPPPPIS
jgi:hypothetical protein